MLRPVCTGSLRVCFTYSGTVDHVYKSVVARERQFFSDCPDGTSLLSVANPTVNGIKGKAVFAVVQCEYVTRDQATVDAYGTLPSPIAVLTLDQGQATGKLTLVKYHNVNTSAAHSLWITYGSSLSPWGTHLSSDEYEPDAFGIASNTMFKTFSKNLLGDAAKDKLAYSALQNMQSSMVRGNAAWNEAYGLTIEKVLNAGAILVHTLSAGIKDTTGAAINSEWVAFLTRTLLVGEDIATDALGNTANPAKWAHRTT